MRILNVIKLFLKGLSFRTGVVMALVCVLCYIISFAQMALPLSLAVKGGLWATFFGLAKASQYAAILILGKAGIDKIKNYFSKRTVRQKTGK